MVECRLDCEDCRHLMIVSLHDTGPRLGDVTECEGWPVVGLCSGVGCDEELFTGTSRT